MSMILQFVGALLNRCCFVFTLSMITFDLFLWHLGTHLLLPLLISGPRSRSPSSLRSWNSFQDVSSPKLSALSVFFWNQKKNGIRCLQQTPPPPHSFPECAENPTFLCDSPSNFF